MIEAVTPASFSKRWGKDLLTFRNSPLPELADSDLEYFLNAGLPKAYDVNYVRTEFTFVFPKP